MKKIFFPLLAAVLLATGACSKDSFVIPFSDGNEFLNDEVYTPSVRIDRVVSGVSDEEQWSWDGEVLTAIATTGSQESTKLFAYANGRVSEVTTVTGDGERLLSYTYVDGKVSRYDVFVDGKPGVVASVTRNSESRIGGADLCIDGTYVMGLVQRFRNGDNNLVNARPATRQALEQLASTLEWMGVAEDDFGTKEDTPNFKVVFNWFEGNVASEVMNGSVRMEVDPERVMDNLALLPETMQMLVYNYLSSHTKLPVKVSLSNISAYTYDTKENPYHGYLGDGLTAQNLSKNNILTARTTGTVRVDLLIGSYAIPLSNRNVDESVELTYLYNAKGYPVQVAGNGLKLFYYCEK